MIYLMICFDTCFMCTWWKCIFPSCFFGGEWVLHPRHMEVPRLKADSELQLLACATATATPDQSCVCDLHHSSQQCQILNPLSKARDRPHVLMDTSQVSYCWVTAGAPRICSFLMTLPTYQEPFHADIYCSLSVQENLEFQSLADLG